MAEHTFSQPPALFTRAGRFIDPQGRQVILHGVNLINKDPRSGYLGSEGPQDFAAMRRWGLNCIRLGLTWDALEPEPGIFNETFLRGLDQRIAWAKENGLYVFLDMHQDLYSVLFSDGAPAWATLTGGKPHVVEGGVWSDAYFTSPAVQAALDHFWKNAPGPDGVGLIEHYARVWQALARRYARESAVIGYDLMNEPFPGSAAVESQFLMFTKGAQLLGEQAGSQAPGVEELALQWMDPSQRLAILERLGDTNLYAQVIDTTQPLYSAFEKGPLMRMYQRVAEAIRSVDSGHILFLEASMGSNMGVYSGLENLALGGKPDPQQAYAPHGYDLVVDTENIAHASEARVELIFSRHAETAARLGLPMLVGEWGAFGRDIPGTLPAAWMVSHQFERHLCSDTYWLYEPDLDRLPPFQAVSRPYPERVAGRLERYGFVTSAGIFECEWLEDPAVSAPTRIYLPGWLGYQDAGLLIDPPGPGWQVEPCEPGGVWLSVPPTGQALRRKLTFRS